MNKLYIRKLCKRNRIGQIIKLMNDNIHLWSENDYEYLNTRLLKYNIDIIDLYIINCCNNNRISSLFDTTHNIVNKLGITKYKIHETLQILYDNCGALDEESILNKACEKENLDVIKYLLSDIMLKSNMYKPITFEIIDYRRGVRYVESSHYGVDLLYDRDMDNAIKFIMSDENIFRIVHGNKIGTIHYHTYSVYNKNIYITYDEYSYKWRLSYDWY